jgi:DNA processing protein
LSRVDGLGPCKFKKLIGKFGTTKRVFEARENCLSQLVGAKVASKIKCNEGIDDIESYIRELEKHEVKFLTYFDDNYPKILKEIHDPPIVIYSKGDYKKADFAKCIAVVGTRNCTRYGKEVVKELVKGLVNAGLIIVSGMAFGIDKMAHEAAINCGGRTIAVLSGGVDSPSPRSNRSIYQNILNHGCVISEYGLSCDIFAGMFPIRNRIIAGISIGTIVIEAGRRSGALITAYQALEQGREVFAVPSDIFSSKSIGTNSLIKKGNAKLVQSVDDILEEFGFVIDCAKDKKRVKSELSPEEKKVIDVLIGEPASIDEIAEKTNIEISRLLQIISIMEIEQKVAKGEKNLYFIVR